MLQNSNNFNIFPPKQETLSRHSFLHRSNGVGADQCSLQAPGTLLGVHYPQVINDSDAASGATSDHHDDEASHVNAFIIVPPTSSPPVLARVQSLPALDPTSEPAHHLPKSKSPQ
eukprot:Gb_07941 [translate_table: standard]